VPRLAARAERRNPSSHPPRVTTPVAVPHPHEPFGHPSIRWRVWIKLTYSYRRKLKTSNLDCNQALAVTGDRFALDPDANPQTLRGIPAYEWKSNCPSRVTLTWTEKGAGGLPFVSPGRLSRKRL